MPYEELRPVIAINILNFDLFDQTDRFHTSYHLYEDEEQFKLTDMMEFHFIEMGKLIKDWKDDKLDPKNDVLTRWLLMLSEIYDGIYLELEGISMKDESLREAFHNWEELSMTQEQRLAYESRLKHILDEEAFKSKMERKAKVIEQGQREIEQGREELEQGKEELEQRRKELEKRERVMEQREKKIERSINKTEQKREEAFARKLLAKGMDPDSVADLANLTIDRVMEIKTSM